MASIKRPRYPFPRLLLAAFFLLFLWAAYLPAASATPSAKKILASTNRNGDTATGPEAGGQQGLEDDNSSSGTNPTTHKCKAVPGTPGWPSDAEWRRLNESLSGRLIRPAPPGSVCHPGQATYDPSRCAAVQSAWAVRDFHVSDPVSTTSNVFSNDTCLPVPSYPCSGEGYPVFVVNATEVEHVQLAVKFSRKHNVRLVVKGTGNDFVGRSVAPNSLSVWTHHMKGLERRAGVFRPRGCPASVEIDGPSLRARAGTQMGEAYAFTDRFNETIVGGGDLTLGIPGWLTGAGHGLLSPTHGLGVDQVLEMEIVTPKGELLTLNECSNEDLFWAMRGGGGSTFGILTSVVLKTHPTPQVASLQIFIVAANSTSPEAVAALPDVAAHVLGDLPRLSAAGAAGYLQIVDRYPTGQPGQERLTGVAGTLTVPYGTAEQAAAAWEPLQRHVAEAWPGVFAAGSSPESFPSFWTWFQAHNDKSPAGVNALLGSWLLDGAALTAGGSTVAAAKFFGGEGSGGLIALVGGKGVMEAKPRGGSTAVLPAWRKTYVQSVTVASFPPLNPAAKAAAVQTLVDRVAALRELAPDMGAYMSEANPWEPNWQAAFWGANYARLRSIKRAVDPDDVLWCHPCVGNEGWREIGDRLCRV